MKAQWMLIVTLVFALITATFAVINVERVRVNFFVSTAEIPLILVIIGSTLLGGLIVGLLGLFRQFKLLRQIRLLEKRLNEQPATGERRPSEDKPGEPADRSGELNQDAGERM